MSHDHLFITDTHAHYQHNNRRAEYLGELIVATRPKIVIHGGDLADMPSLSSYDRGKKSFQGRTYKADIAAAQDFMDRLYQPLRKAKRKMPHFIFLEGNHEQRISRAIDLQPELEGAISFDDLELDNWFDDVVRYNGSTPGLVNIDGINYAHYMVSGIMGRPLSGEHPATSLLSKQLESCAVGHSHLADWSVRTTAQGRKLFGLVGGCYIDYRSDWAGAAQELWWRGVTRLRGVRDGVYDPQFISLEALRREYGKRKADATKKRGTEELDDSAVPTA